MKVESALLSTLSADPANVRKHPQRNIETIIASLKRFGQQKPIVVDAKGIIRAGNGTYEAAKSLGWDSLDVVRTELIGPEATAYAIADNRTAELAEWDEENLVSILESLDADVREAAGWNEAELVAMTLKTDPSIPSGDVVAKMLREEEKLLALRCHVWNAR